MASTTWYKTNEATKLKEHSVNFGEISGRGIIGANTWSSWHLIPPSRPTIAHPPFTTKYIEIPGADGYVDLSNYLIGRPNFGARTGSLQFYVDNEHENWEAIRTKVVSYLHGKKLKMQLTDDLKYYYEGRFKVDSWESGQQRSAITISYQLDPFKRTIDTYGLDDIIWDTFNFETDFDYYEVCHHATITGAGLQISIPAILGYCTPTVSCLSGSVNAWFSDQTAAIPAGTAHTFERSLGVDTIMYITGSGVVDIYWKGEAL